MISEVPFPASTCHSGDSFKDSAMKTIAWGSAPAMDGHNVSVQDVLIKMLAAKRAANRRERYVRELDFFLRMFIRGKEDWPLSAFTIDVIESWLSNRHYASSATSSNIGKISTLFVFAMKRGWVEFNPCWRMEKITVDRMAPKILTVDQAEQLLHWCAKEKPKALAYLVLCLLCGVRPDEACSLEWSAIGGKFGFICVDAKVAKMRQRRIIHLEANASLWLEYAYLIKSPLPASIWMRRYWVNAFRDVLSLRQWPQDLLRHSNASYWLALREDASYVALQLGNSAPILHRHYKELVPKSEAERYFSILPFK